MYSYEDRMRAVKLYIQYDRSAAATMRELGYPSRKNLAIWYEEYKEYEDLHRRFPSNPKFTSEQKQTAVDYYFEHGGSALQMNAKLTACTAVNGSP